MKERNSQDLIVNVALALFAGVLGSLMTLFVTSNLKVPIIDESALATVETPVSEVDTLTTLSAVDGLSDQSPSDAMANAEIHAALSDSLEQASAERVQLADVLAQLTRQIETLESDAINRQAREVLQFGETTDETQENIADAGNASGDSAQRSGAQERLDSLVAAGIDVQQAQAIQSRQDQYQLARLELIDQAEREDWRDTDQFSERMAELDEQRPDLRTELGDENFDRYLFESGRDNRVMASAIIPGSVAESAGLQAGDMVVSYANQRIFSTRELQRATREGLRGELVPITVQREGQTLYFDVPRGPLGINLSAEQQSPS